MVFQLLTCCDYPIFSFDNLSLATLYDWANLEHLKYSGEAESDSGNYTVFCCCCDR